MDHIRNRKHTFKKRLRVMGQLADLLIHLKCVDSAEQLTTLGVWSHDQISSNDFDQLTDVRHCQTLTEFFNYLYNRYAIEHK